MTFFRAAARYRSLVTLGVAFASTPLLGQAPQLTTITYTTPSITAVNWPYFVATANGYFQREGLRVDMVQIDPNSLVAGVLSGSAQISLNAPVSIVLADDKGADLVAIGSGCEHPPYNLMAPASIKTIKDLRGQTISSPSITELYNTVVRQLLTKAGLDPDNDVHWLYGGGQNQRFAALLGGAVQAGLVTPPNDAALSARGFHSLAFTPDHSDLPLSVTGTKRDWAKQHPEIVRGFLRAMASAAQWLNNPKNRSSAISLLQTNLKTTPAEASGAYDAFIVRAHVFPNNYCSARPDLVAVINAMRDLKTTAATAADVDKYADTQWCS